MEGRPEVPGCEGVATAVDHKIERFEGGELYDEENLQAACTPCNSRKHMNVLARRAAIRVREW